MASRRQRSGSGHPHFNGNDENGDDDGERGPRPFWSGTITFGLVSIPVSLYSAYNTISTSLRMLAPDGTPLARRYFCSKDGKEVDRDHIVRGYELEKERYVVVTDEELEGLEPKKSRDIELSRFVDVAAIPPSFFERAYFLAPASESTRAYQLLATSMERLGKAGIATFVMRGKEHLVAIFSRRGVLMAETMRFADELRTVKDVGLQAPERVSQASVTRFRKIIQKQAKKALDLGELKDEYWNKLRAAAERKLKSGTGVLAVPQAANDSEQDEGSAPANVVDLMAILKRRLAGIEDDEADATPVQPSPGKRAKSSPRASKAAKRTKRTSSRKTA